MDVLIRLIRDQYDREYAGPTSRDEVEAFVRRAFRARNINPTAALVEQVVNHLLYGAKVGHLRGLTIRHCGT